MCLKFRGMQDIEPATLECFWWLSILKVKFEAGPDIYIYIHIYIYMHMFTRTRTHKYMYWCMYFQLCRYKPEIRDPKIISPIILSMLEFHSLRALQAILTYQLCAGPHSGRLNELHKSIDSSIVHVPTTPSPIENSTWTICWSPDTTHPFLHLPRLLSWNWGVGVGADWLIQIHLVQSQTQIPKTRHIKKKALCTKDSGPSCHRGKCHSY